MNPIAGINVGSEAEATTVVTPEVTVRHFHANMPEGLWDSLHDLLDGGRRP
jgi:hypothetical protein